MTYIDIMEYTKLFDMTQMKGCPRKGEQRFTYGNYIEQDVQSAIKTLGEHLTIGDIISFGLAVGDFERDYFTENTKDAFTTAYGRDVGLIQVFLTLYSEWYKQSLGGDEDAFFYDYVYRLLTETQETIDEGGYSQCSNCGSVLVKDYVFYHNGQPVCGHCAHLISLK